MADAAPKKFQGPTPRLTHRLARKYAKLCAASIGAALTPRQSDSGGSAAARQSVSLTLCRGFARVGLASARGRSHAPARKPAGGGYRSHFGSRYKLGCCGHADFWARGFESHCAVSRVIGAVPSGPEACALRSGGVCPQVGRRVPSTPSVLKLWPGIA